MSTFDLNNQISLEIPQDLGTQDREVERVGIMIVENARMSEEIMGSLQAAMDVLEIEHPGKYYICDPEEYRKNEPGSKSNPLVVGAGGYFGDLGFKIDDNFFGKQIEIDSRDLLKKEEPYYRKFERKRKK